MTDPLAAARRSADRAPARRPVSGLRWQALAAAAAVIVQYVLGMIVNLYATIPAADRGAGFTAAIGRAVSHGPAALATHAVVGLLLIIMALAVAVRAVVARLGVVATLAVIALLCLIGAASSGASFVGAAQASASMSMAVLAGAALLLYLIILYLLPAETASRRNAGPQRP
jgi:hypothetical protein